MQKEPGKNYYVEPVEIEIYLKKAGKVRTIIKDMFIELIDVVPLNKKSAEIFEYFQSLSEPIDLMEARSANSQNVPGWCGVIWQIIKIGSMLTLKSGTR